MQKNFKKKLLAACLILAMVLGCLTGCGAAKGGAASDTAGTGNTGKESSGAGEAAVTEPITIRVLSKFDMPQLVTPGTDINDLYCFRYLEYYMRQQGYDVTIEVEDAGTEINEKISLLLSTGDLPDLIWGISLSNLNAVVYGCNEKMLLDWTPYINDEKIMPNVYALTQSQPEAFLDGTCPDGGLYALPYLEDRTYCWNSGTLAATDMYIDADWLEACNLEPPTTVDEWIDMMRAFQQKKKADGGDGVVYMGVPQMEGLFWNSLGYFGGSTGQFGTGIVIKDGELWIPAATEDYREWIEWMHTIYTEGLIAEDYFTMDSATANSLAASLEYPMTAQPNTTIVDPKVFEHWIAAPPIVGGDTDKLVASVVGSNITQGVLWAPADTEHPEVIAKMLDYLFSKEGYEMYAFGPKEGEDPLGLLDGWYVKDGTLTTKAVEEGVYPSWEEYANSKLYTNAGKVGSAIGCSWTSRNEDGSSDVGEESYIDGLTGKEVKTTVRIKYTYDNIDGAGRLKRTEWAETGHATIIRLPGVYLQPEDANRASELQMLINDQITTSSVNFITGARPLDELDQYFEELKGLGVEEYLGIYREAYSDFMERTFG